MEKFTILFFLFCNYSDSFGQNARISVNIKSKEFAGKDIKIVFNRSDIGEKGFGFKQITGKKGISKILLECKEPFYCYIELRKGDSLLKRSGSFLVTRSNIKVEFDINIKFPLVAGGENDYLFENRTLLFEMPAIISKYSGFSCKMIKKEYAFLTDDYRLQTFINEYESNIINTISAKSNFYFVLQRLWGKVECISLKTLDICYNKISNSLKETELGHSFKNYIINSKKLYSGKPIPTFSVYKENGDLSKSEEILSAGKFVFIDFWASWCAPCRIQMKELKKTYSFIDSAKCSFISISIDDDKQKWLEASQEDKIEWANYYAPGGWQGEVGSKFNLTYIPQNVLIDSSGKIINSNLSKEELETFLKKNNLIRDQN